ncbi:hypothetical protein KUCAC02_021145 [Chaenocephalus aceratus]|uniref:Uncharacterized protein n=1 Tax=Chaenocephalus aceratus TaxID=36190 RepID=A0ACB9XEP2_CHAAC|nr:hypothetical protein KUCAC02_021145 [Chaenocephalus aceratus]
MRGEGGGPSGTGAWRMEGRGDGGGCFTAAVSLLLRAGILMRSAPYWRTCSAILIEQMICQFVMFIFRGVLASMPCAAQPPQNTVQMLAELFL